MGDSTPFPSPAAIARAELFTRERFVYEGETLDDALAPGSARRGALDAALSEIEAGAKQPSIEWRRQFSLLLGPRAAALRGRAEARRRHRALRPPGRRAVRHADRAARRGAAQHGMSMNGHGPRTSEQAAAVADSGNGDSAGTPTRMATRTRTPTRPPPTRSRPTRPPSSTRTPARTRSPRTGRTTTSSTRTSSRASSPRTPTPTAASGSSTRPAPARPSPRSASSRPRAPAAS